MPRCDYRIRSLPFPGHQRRQRSHRRDFDGQDLLPFMRSDANLQHGKVLRRAVVVPESKRVDRMLKEFRSQRYHMAIVIDEFGGVSGLVTIEDILELIVGGIEDEYDEEDIDFRQLSRHTWTVRALASIEDFNDAFGTHFSDEGGYHWWAGDAGLWSSSCPRRNR